MKALPSPRLGRDGMVLSHPCACSAHPGVQGDGALCPGWDGGCVGAVGDAGHAGGFYRGLGIAASLLRR